MTLTTGADLADDVSAARGNLQSDFKFTSGNETVTANTSTLTAGDTLLDASTTDNDVLNITALAANAVEATISNIETINVTSSNDAAALDTTAWGGVKNVNVTGTGNVALNDIDAASLQPTIAINNYAQIATVNVATLAGTTSSAETVNLSVSGATWGTTAATQSGVTITSDNAGTLETLNITSTGSAANTFTLDAGGNTTLNTVNLLGSAAQTVRVSDADITGVTVVGSAATGDTAVRISRVAADTAGTNVANFTGVDNIIVADDQTTPDATLELDSLKSAQKVTVVADMATGSILTFQGATRSAPAASLTLVLDNDTASADVDFAGTLNIQNVATLNLVSNGVTATASSAVNNFVGALTGDFTTITITGDTRIDFDALTIDAAGADADVARTVTVNASGLTGLADIDVTVGASTLVSYEITGSANDDALVLNAAGGVLNGGAGNDALTGGAGDDEINGGTGNDTIVSSVGTDTIEGGTGNDTFNIVTDIETTAAVQGVTTFTAGATLASGVNALAAADIWVMTVNDKAYFYTAGSTTVDTAGAAAVAALAGQILIEQDVTLSYTADTNSFVFTGNADGTEFDVTLDTIDADVSSTALNSKTATATATATAGDLVDFTVSDFASGDVLNILSTMAGGGGYLEGASTAQTAGVEYDYIVLTAASYASNDAAGDAIAASYTGTDTDNQVFVYLDSSLGHAVAVYDSSINVDTDATLNQFAEFTGITTLTQLAAAFSSDSFV